jgi:hypothetical protein
MLNENHDNPYATPVSEVKTSAGVKTGSAVKAVTVGVAVDIGGSLIVGIVLSIAYGIYLATTGASAEQIESSMTNMPVDSWFFIFGAVIGSAFSVLGAYLCTRIARHSEYKLGAIMAAISISFGLFVGIDQYSPLVNVVMVIAALASITLGVWLGIAKNKLQGS